MTELDSSFTAIRHTPLFIKAVRFFEDVRLISFKGRLIALYAFADDNMISPEMLKWKMGIGVVNESTGEIEHTSLEKWHIDKREKNWTPCIAGNSLLLIRSFNPLIIYRVADDIGNIELITFRIAASFYYSEEKGEDWEHGELHGGTPFIEHGEWHYSFVHAHRKDIIVKGTHYWRYYNYTIARFNPATCEFQYYSNPLPVDATLTKVWCLFPCGIMEYIKGVIISYGVNDCSAYLCSYSWDFIESCFDK